MSNGKGANMTQPAVRMEHDLLGEKLVPQEAYYGFKRLVRWRTSTFLASNCVSTLI
jgi:aspartate ammonia-lyase